MTIKFPIVQNHISFTNLCGFVTEFEIFYSLIQTETEVGQDISPLLRSLGQDLTCGKMFYIIPILTVVLVVVDIIITIMKMILRSISSTDLEWTTRLPF